MRTRFAPSPTGFIHIGNARSAVLNWAYAKKNGGKFILRIDDTDNIRSKIEFEKKIKDNLLWLGIEWEKTFNQSDRKDIYEYNINKLKKIGRLYPCFESEEELSLKKKSLLSSGKPPIYDRSSLNLTVEEINNYIKKGKNPHWRFKLDQQNIFWQDLIKGDISFDTKNLSDPILIREDGSLLYHLPSVIDDISENITDIIRGEDHLSNTAYHIQIFKALNSKIPNFAHHPFLIDNLGKSFGKRIGSLSIEDLIKEDYENITLLNYLINIGSNKNIIAEKNIKSLIDSFDLKNISSSPPKFSIEVLKNLNKEILQSYEFIEVSQRLSFICKDLPEEKLWIFSKNNINFFSDIINWIKIIKEEIPNRNNVDINFLNIAIECLPKEPFNEYTWNQWTQNIKNKTELKGKNIFMPLRIALTGIEKGPELKYLLPLLNKKAILKKFGKI